MAWFAMCRFSPTAVKMIAGIKAGQFKFSGPVLAAQIGEGTAVS